MHNYCLPFAARPAARIATTAAAAFAAWCGGPQCFAAQTTDEFRILYFEPIAIGSQSTHPGTDKSLQSLPAKQPKHISFAAYGRVFEIDLEPNPGLNTVTAADTATVAYRGSVIGVAQSWARITQTSAATYGTVWDGNDLYVIEPAADAKEFAVAPLDMRNASTVIYRLSDTLIRLPGGFCEALDGAASSGGAQAYQALTDELRSHVAVQAIGATKRIQIGALGDAAFRSRYSTDQDATDAIMVLLNNVDGIYSSQLSVEVQTPSVTLYVDNDPFSGTTQPSVLLTELSQVRQASSVQSSLGLTHLFTGRDLDGDTVGIAYTNAICKSYGVSLTEVRGRGSFIESLIAAHEIGHNFGAPHDGEGACKSAPSGFLMAPAVNGSDQFSQCSLTQIRSVISSASCITPLAPADASVPSSLNTVAALPSELFSTSVSVTNLGGVSATNVQVALTVPANFSIEAASINGDDCVQGAGGLQCNAGTLAASAVATINLSLRSSTAGQFSVGFSVTSDVDANALNNAASLPVNIQANDPSPVQSPAPAASSGGGNGGGGGSVQWPLLAALGGLAWRRCRARRQ